MGFLYDAHRYMDGFGLGLPKVHLDSIKGREINGVKFLMLIGARFVFFMYIGCLI